MPRIGIKNNNNQSDDYESFFNELEEKMDIIKDQLLDRFEKQGNKKVHEFPFLIGEGILLDGERAKPEDKIRKVIKQSSMGIGFLGLEECLIALTGYTRTQNKQTKKLGLKIIDFMRNKVNEYSTKYNLNFVLIGVDDKKVSEEFMALDKAIYGKLEKITDKELYTESFYIPEGEKLEEKIEIESPYHELTNGGHIINLRLEEKNPEAVEAILKELKEKNVGYASVN